jgi:hypothetical protein
MTTSKKTCFKCGNEKPLTEFYRHKRMADGYLGKCKCCAKIDVLEHRHGKGRESVLKYERKRAQTSIRVELRRRTVKVWEALYPERKAAQTKLSNAVRDGRVTPLPCLVCGGKAEAHHPDYSAPLDVVWLCPSHHKQAHADSKRSIEAFVPNKEVSEGENGK